MNSFRLMMAKPELDAPVVIGPWNGPYETGWNCVELPITQKNLQSTLTYYNQNRVSAVATFWEFNTDQSEPDRTTTLIGLSGDSFTEPVVFSDTEVFYGFEGTYFNNEIQTLGLLVHDPACSIDVVEIDDPEELEPEPVTNTIENPFKPECIVSKGNLVGDTENVALGTPFTSKNQWQEFDTKMVPVSIQLCILNAGSDNMNSFRLIMAKPEPDSPVVAGSWNGPYE